MARLPTDTSAAALSAALAAPAAEKDDFGDAFTQFSAPVVVEPAKTLAEAPAKTDAAPAEPAADGKEAPAKAEETGTEIEGAPEPAEGETKTPEEIKAEADAAAAAEAAKAKPAADDPFARLADLITQRQPAPKTEAEPAVKPAPPPPLYSAEEVTQIQNFYKEWPEVAPAVEVLLRGAITQTTNTIYAEVARVLGPKLQMLEQIANNAVYDQIQKAVPDYDDALQERVSAWVQKQPAYLRGAFTSVMQNGTAGDITDLVNRYRQETGEKAASAGETITKQETQPNPDPAKAAALSPAAKKAVAALAPVNSKRTGNTQVEPQTFDDAFDVFSKAG